MSKPSVLFIPDRFTDYRLWYDIPDRLQGCAEVIHFDQHEQISWTADNAEFVEAARRLPSNGSFCVVAAAGKAARFAFALAEAGLAKGMGFFQPTLDSIPEDVHVDLSDMGEALAPLRPLTSTLDDPDPVQQRDTLLQFMRDTAGTDREPAEVELEIAMMSDHSAEFFAHLQATAAAAADGKLPPDPPWIRRPWIDRLAEMNVPVTVIGVGPALEAIARRAKYAEIVLGGGNGGMTPPDDRSRAAEALLRLLERVR